MLKFSLKKYQHIAKFAATRKKEARYYLKGVCIEPCKNLRGVSLTGTDGHAIGSFYDPLGSAELVLTGSKSLIVQLDKHKVAAWIREGASHIGIEVGSEVEVTLFDVTRVMRKEAENENIFIRAEFPNWRKVLPNALPAQAQVNAFNANLLDRFKFNARKDNVLHLFPAGRNKITVVFVQGHEEFIGGFMPMDKVTKRDMIEKTWYYKERK